MRSIGLSGRVLLRLEQAEVCELNPHFRDDYRIAWITVLNAERGSAIPHIVATYAVLGMHPDKVWPWIVAWRKAKLGSEYEEFWGASASRKPVQSENRPAEAKAVA